MKMRLTRAFVVLLMLVPIALKCQDHVGARTMALGGTGITLSDTWSAFNNQAGLGNQEGISAGAFYTSYFGLNELSTRGAVVNMAVGDGAFGLTYRSFGYALFNSSKLGLAYGMALSEKFSIGVQINYLSLVIPEGYGRSNAFSVEGGFIYKMSEKLTIAAHLYNPNRTVITEVQDTRARAFLKAGAGYAFSDKVKMMTEAVLENDEEVSVRVGVEYLPVKSFVIRAGAGTQPNSTSFGFGAVIKNFRLDVAAGFHPVLGWSPQLAMSYSLRGE